MSSNSPDAEVLVHTALGTLKGQRNTSIYDDNYYSFECIPFAQPPLGALRFKAPLAATPWPGVLDCTQKAKKPIQKNPRTNEIEGDEDCLYLNIYAKELASDKPLPVMVFLYGGGFERGDPTRDLHGPDYFMMKDVILVTIAYRLGPLGFLSLPDPAVGVPGNAGLKDQLLGLQWVADNISAFNGDPKNITLFGESAGAASTHYMMLTPLAKGLFHKAILMSGTVLCPWALSPVKELPKRLAQANGYTGDGSVRSVLDYLQHLPAEELVRPYLLTREENMDDCLFAFGPVVEPYLTDNCIIPKQPHTLFANAWGNDIPLIISGTSFEGLLMFARIHMAPYLLHELNENHQHMLPLELKQKHDLDKQKELASKLRETHFAEKELRMEHVLNYCEYASYKVFWHPILRTVKARLRHARAPTYLYRFDFDSPEFNHQRIGYCGKEVRGVSHVDDHSYLFYGNFAWKLDKDTPEFRTIQRKIDIWTSFAANSDPSCEKLGESKWMPLQSDGKLHCLNVGEHLEVIELPEMHKLQVWDSLYEVEEE
ncbi:esterase B1-like [Rhagoletis pomonella]|uniref:esterase B1-like n=1 Tax=Rhagoletis pomonella TaxID=28610 RepID=UPI001780A8EC|nr:esterase B1-like [Rhagoletis pomonella]